MRISVLVNGPAEKTNGVRVRELFHDLVAEHETTFLYRDDLRKWASARAFYAAMRRSPPDIVYVEGLGYAGLSAALTAKARYGTRVMLSTGDAAYALALSSMTFFKAQAVGLMELVALRCTDTIVVWGSYHQELLLRRGFRNVFWIPGGVDTSRFRPMDVADLRSRMGVADRLTIGVVGSINFSRKHQFCYGWEIVEAVRLLKGQPVVGLIVGVGDGLPFLHKKVAEYGVEDQVIFTGWIDHDELPKYINLIDVCVSTQSADLVGQVRITAKVPEYLACGRYIIASDVGGARAFVKDSGLLLEYKGVRDHAYVESMVAHVRRIIEDRAILRSGLKGIETAKKFFDYSVLRPKLREAVQHTRDVRDRGRKRLTT